MTHPAARVLALLEVLQNGGTRTTGELAGRLGVQERTVRRYVQHLLDLEVPVESVRGRHGGYRLAPGFRMPPLMLTDEEALAVLLSLVAGSRAGLVTTSTVTSGASPRPGAPPPGTPGTAPEAVESAVAKLRRVLPKRLRSRLDAVLETAEFTAPPRPVAGPEADVLLALAEAARARRPVAVGYTGRDGRRSDRVLHPYGIVAHSGRWYVTGADSASGEVRTFRLDRIARATVRDGVFEVPDGFDPSGQVLAGLAGTPWRHRVSVRVRGAVADIRLPPGLATFEPIDADWVRVRLRAERLDWLPGVLAGLGLPFVVEEPAELRDGVRALAHRLLDSTQPSPPARGTGEEG